MFGALTFQSQILLHPIAKKEGSKKTGECRPKQCVRLLSMGQAYQSYPSPKQKLSHNDIREEANGGPSPHTSKAT